MAQAYPQGAGIPTHALPVADQLSHGSTRCLSKRHRFAKLHAERRGSLANIQRFVNHNHQLAECWRSAGVAAMKNKIVMVFFYLSVEHW
jgi:hypothetical protein